MPPLMTMPVGRPCPDPVVVVGQVGVVLTVVGVVVVVAGNIFCSQMKPLMLQLYFVVV